MKEYKTYFLSRGMEHKCFLAWWPLCNLALDASPDPFSYTCFSQSIDWGTLFKVSHVVYKEFQCSHVWSLFSLLCSSKQFRNALFCVCDWVDHKNSLQQSVLCLNEPKAKPIPVLFLKFDPTPATELCYAKQPACLLQLTSLQPVQVTKIVQHTHTQW